MEASGRFRDRKGAELHMTTDGSRRVIVSAPGKDMDASFVLGANHGQYDPERHWIIDNASCTTNALAPALKVLHEAYGIRIAIFETVHAYTADQQLVDAPHSDLRRGRGAAQSIVPTSTGASEAIARILPGVNVVGGGTRVPVADGSFLSISAFLNDPPKDVDQLRSAFRAAAQTAPLAGVLEASEEPLVSQRILRNQHSSIADLLLFEVHRDLARVFTWYDNVAGYSARLAEVARGSNKKAFGRPTTNVAITLEALGG